MHVSYSHDGYYGGPTAVRRSRRECGFVDAPLCGRRTYRYLGDTLASLLEF